MNKAELEEFLVKARTKTYAGAVGKTNALLPGAVQYEFAEDDYLYRDTYYIGNGIFPGLETVFYKRQPVWSMSYFGDFSQMTEEQADTMLRQALIDLWQTTRTYRDVVKEYKDFTYYCHGHGSIDQLDGIEEIIVDGLRVYSFVYAGGFIR